MQRTLRTCRSGENAPFAGIRPCLCRPEERIRPSHPGKTRPVVRRPLGRYASAFLMRSGVNGAWRKRAPVSWAIALPIAGVTNGVAICPTPVGSTGHTAILLGCGELFCYFRPLICSCVPCSGLVPMRRCGFNPLLPASLQRLPIHFHPGLDLGLRPAGQIGEVSGFLLEPRW